MPVLDDLCEGHDHRLGLIGGIEVIHPHPLDGQRRRGVGRLPTAGVALGGVASAVKRRNVDSGDGGQAAQDRDTSLAARPPIAHGVQDLVHGRLTVADQYGVEEVGDRLGVGGARAAADDNWFLLAATLCAAGDACQVEEVRNVDVVELGLQGDADDVELGNRPVGLQGVQGNLLGAHRCGHVRHRCEAALGEGVLPSVDQVIENSGSLVGHADLVSVGEGQGDPHADRVPGLPSEVFFETEVPRGLLNPGQDLVESGTDAVRRGLNHRYSLCPGTTGVNKCI